MKVRVTFDYVPDDPADVDEEDPSGLAEAAFVELGDQIANLGGENITCEAVTE